MRSIGNLDTGNHQILAPFVVVLVCDSATGIPQYALTQVNTEDVPFVTVAGVKYQTISLLEDFKYSDIRPQQGGGLHRRNISMSVASQHLKGYPFFQLFPSKAFYQCGQSADAFYFSVYAIDLSKQFEDIRSGLHLGVYKLNQNVTWDEQQSIVSISLQDILQADKSYVGATAEVIPDFFFLYNQNYSGGIIPKAFGQVPRVRMLNAFPSFSIKKLANSTNGIVGAVYTNVSSTILLEQNVDQFSVLKQLAGIGGTARVRMKDGEVIAGTLVYDSGANTITLTSLTRNTYYRQVQAYMDSGDGNTPDKWPRGPAAINQPNYSTVSFSPTRTVIPNAKELLLGDTGWLQADITFYDASALNKSNLQTNRACKVTSLPASESDDKTKLNVVIHDIWPDNRYAAGISSAASISTFFAANSNAQNFPPGTVVLWGWEGFELMEFYATPKPMRLFFNDPATAVGGGAIGDGWTLVGFEPASVDYSGYLRNGYSKLDIDHVYCQGEGRLIKIPAGHITSISSSTTVYGLTNLMRVQLDMAPLDMAIGATSNDIYVDVLYKTGALNDRTEAVIQAILQESNALYALAGATITDRTLWPTDAWLPYTGWICREETRIGEIIDKFMFQCGINLTWQGGKFQYQLAAWARGIWEKVTLTAVDYIHYLGPFTDQFEMIENSANVSQGQLITEVSSGFERVPMFVNLDFGGWDDPYYKPARNFQDRTISQTMSKFKYTFDLINDTNNFAFAVDLMLSIGHAAGLVCCERMLKCKMVVPGLRWESQDPIMLKDFPLITTADETDAVFDTARSVITDATLPLYRLPADGTVNRLCGGLAMVDSVNITFGQPGQSALVDVVAKVAQLKLFPKGWGNNTGKSIKPGKPPTLPTNPNLPPAIPAGTGNVPVLPGFDVPFVPGDVDLFLIDGTGAVSHDMPISIDGNLVFSRGYPWSVSVVDTDIDVGPNAGIWFTGDVGGTVPTPCNTTLNKTLTIHVNYLAFKYNSLNEPQRSVTIRFDLFKAGYEDSPMYIDHIYRQVYINRADLRGIVAS